MSKIEHILYKAHKKRYFNNETMSLAQSIKNEKSKKLEDRR